MCASQDLVTTLVYYVRFHLMDRHSWGRVLAFILLLVSGCTLQLNLVFSIGTRLVCVAVLPCASSIWCHWHSASSTFVSLPPSICSPPTPLTCLLSPTVGPPLLLPIYFHVEIVSYIFSGRKWVVSPHLCVCTCASACGSEYSSWW